MDDVSRGSLRRPLPRAPHGAYFTPHPPSTRQHLHAPQSGAGPAEAWEPRSTAHGAKYRGPARKLLAARRTKSARSLEVRCSLAEATLITGSSQTSAAPFLAEPNPAFASVPASARIDIDIDMRAVPARISASHN